jgi:RNA polymerase sigma factor (sigma-70 family)
LSATRPYRKRYIKVVSIESGDRARVLAARDRLVEAHLGLVREIAERIAAGLPPSFDLDDLVGAGNLALIRAATRYRPAAHNGTPFSAYARPIVRGAIYDSVRRRNYTENTRPAISIDRDERALEVAGETVIDELRRAEKIRLAVAGLPEKLRTVIELHYSDGLKLSEVGPIIGRTPGRASQIHMEAIELLRVALAETA